MKRPIALFMIMLTLVSVLPWRASATPPFPREMQKKLNELVGASGSTYRSNEAIDVLLDDYLTKRTAGLTPQQALNGVVAAPALNTSPKATLIIVVDDQEKEWWNGTNGGVAIRTIMKTNHLVAGVSVGAYYITRGDTVNTSLSVSNLRNLRDHDGWEIGSGGYFEGTQGGALGGWWNGNSGKLVTGSYTQAQLDAAMDLHFAGNRRALEDTLGLGPMADWHSHSNSSGSSLVYPYMDAAGIKYGVTSQTIASNGQSRQSVYYPATTAYFGMSGTGGIFTSNTPYISAIPGNHLNRFEIPQTVNESMDSTAVRKITKYAMVTKGLIVYNLHSFTTHEGNLAGTNGFTQLCNYWGALIAAGRLQCVVPSVGFKIYYDNKWSDAINYGTTKFQDLDADGRIDTWFSGTSGSSTPSTAAADTAKINRGSSAALFKYAGQRTGRLNWAGAGTATGAWAALLSGAASDSTWKKPNAVKVVLIPAGSGWTVTAEMRAICDTTVASAVQPDNKAGTGANRKYVGINFYTAFDQRSYVYTSSPQFAFLYNTGTSAFMPWMSSHGANNDTSTPGVSQTFEARNNIHRSGHEWMFVTQSWDIPRTAGPYLLVNVYKQTTFPANEVIITDPVIRFYNRNTGEVIDAQNVTR